MNALLNGIVIVDKPANISSAKVVARLKKILKLKKVGHTGTLDPFATGLMICCINQGTKLSRFFINQEKTYEAKLILGVETDTQDCKGKVISENTIQGISDDTILHVFNDFKGKIKQTPPIYSALKHQGTPLYKLARKGISVQKPAREIFISSIIVKKINLPYISFEVTCSAGTYVRTIAHDIGKILKCGAHLDSLRRTKSCGFTINKAMTLEKIENYFIENKTENIIINMSDALRNMPAYFANDTLSKKIKHGSSLLLHEISQENMLKSSDFIKVIDQNQNLIAIVEYLKNEKKYKYCCVFNS